MMKIESRSNMKTWSQDIENANTHGDSASTQDLYLACFSFLVLLFVAVADATLKM